MVTRYGPWRRCAALGPSKVALSVALQVHCRGRQRGRDGLHGTLAARDLVAPTTHGTAATCGVHDDETRSAPSAWAMPHASGS